MSQGPLFVLQARATDRERASVHATAEHLLYGLQTATGSAACRLQVQYTPPGASIAPLPGALACLLSMMVDVERLAEPMATIEARWQTQIALLAETGVPIFLQTVFRYLPDRPRDGRTPPVLERIRRLNRLAIDLSHAHGCCVIDLDRIFAHSGGQFLATDWRLQGSRAIEVAGYRTALSMFAFGLDATVDVDVQEKARQALLHPAYVRRRLSKLQAQTAQGLG